MRHRRRIPPHGPALPRCRRDPCPDPCPATETVPHATGSRRRPGRKFGRRLPADGSTGRWRRSRWTGPGQVGATTGSRWESLWPRQFRGTGHQTSLDHGKDPEWRFDISSTDPITMGECSTTSRCCVASRRESPQPRGRRYRPIVHRRSSTDTRGQGRGTDRAWWRWEAAAVGDGLDRRCRAETSPDAASRWSSRPPSSDRQRRPSTVASTTSSFAVVVCRHKKTERLLVTVK